MGLVNYRFLNGMYFIAAYTKSKRVCNMASYRLNIIDHVKMSRQLYSWHQNISLSLRVIIFYCFFKT
jgi:hypothetical protein